MPENNQPYKIYFHVIVHYQTITHDGECNQKDEEMIFEAGDAGQAAIWAIAKMIDKTYFIADLRLSVKIDHTRKRDD